MNLTVATAVERHWCNFCPDLILPGEIAASGDGFLNPMGGPGYAHADCAAREGYNPVGDASPESVEAWIRRDFRDALHGEVPS